MGASMCEDGVALIRQSEVAEGRQAGTTWRRSKPQVVLLLPGVETLKRSGEAKSILDCRARRASEELAGSGNGF